MRHKASIASVIFGVATAAPAQQSPSSSQDQADQIQQEYREQLRRSTLVGPDDNVAIELPNGELISVGRESGCLPPQTRGGLIKVDCTMFDGPAHYFDASTKAMVESCSFWFPDLKRCPPKQWPVDVPGCSADVPVGITGSWRLYGIPSAGGFSSVEGGWAVTLSDQSITFDFGGVAPIERSYAVVERDDRRYTLEIRDDRSESTLVKIDLAPCGLFIESEGVCDAFCENVADEVGRPSDDQIRDIAERLSGGQDEALLERAIEAIRESIARGPQPVFFERAFFVAAVSQ